jgi:hypothetical protein
MFMAALSFFVVISLESRRGLPHSVKVRQQAWQGAISKPPDAESARPVGPELLMVMELE